MNRLQASLIFAAFGMMTSCAAGASPDSESPAYAAFRFRPKDKYHLRIESDFAFTERAGGGDSDRPFWKGGLSGQFKLSIDKTDLAMVFAKLEPLEFEYRRGARTVSLKDSKIIRNRDAEEDDLKVPSEGSDLELHRDGLLLKVEPSDSWIFFGYLLSNPPSLLSWLGPLDPVELREGNEVKAQREVMLVHSTALPIVTAGKVTRRAQRGWQVQYKVGVDRTSDRYGWLKTCVETGTGMIELDEGGCPLRASLDWRATTADGTAIAHYRWSCEFTR